MKLTKKTGADKFQKQLLRLQKTVDRKTIELQQKNYELTIQSALEHVRTVAMKMNRPADMLTICKTISQQLAKLGVKEIRNVQTAVIRKEKGTYINYEFYAKHNKLLTTEVSYTDHAMTKAFINKMLDGPNEFFTRSLKGKKVQEWYAFQKKSTKQFPDHYLLKATSLHYYWYSLGPIALGVSTYEPLSKEEQELIVRFRNVFELSYRRFLDIEKATAQAREAQIEAALERVRAAAMAMRNSTELSNIIYKLYGELTKLDAKLDRCFIMIVNPENKGITWWLAGKEGLLAENGFFIQANQHPTHVMYLDNWKKRKKKWQYKFEGKEKKDWDKFGFSKTELSRLPEFIKKDMAAVKKVYLSGSSDQFGSLVTGSLEPLPDEQQEIISRFTIAFNQAYIRFLDLQKAEAQARENQIQLALERVRARTMAMQKSEELPETSHILFEQMKELGEPVEQLTIGIVNEEHKVIEISATLLGDTLKKIYNHSIEEPYMMAKVYKAWKKQQKTLVVELKGNELNAYNRYRNELTNSKMFPTNVGKEQQRIVYAAFFSKGMLALGSNEPRPPQSLQLLERFASVFDLTYTRFLDLQKAEAQAREAQIEAALERVRSSAMAMHSSEGILEVTQVLREQVALLGEKELESILVHIYHEDTNQFEAWYSYRHPDNPDEQIINGRQLFGWSDTARARKDKEQYFLGASDYTIVADYNMLKEWYEYLFGIIPEVVEVNPEGTPLIPDVLYYNYSKFSGGALLLITNSEASAHSKYLLNRAASVFNLTYSRFLDLQKAEAQAREAQIEAALEKVRSRTLAMQKSDELAETAAVLFQQLILLGIEPNRLYIIIMQEDKPDMEAWVTDEDGSKVNMGFTGNYQKNQSLKKMYEGWVQQKKSLVIDMQGRELQEYFYYLNDELKVPFKGGLEQKRRIQHLAYFSHGLIGMASPDDQPGETLQLMERFAAVFNLTFARFNDLKIAEAHARQSEQDLIAIKEAKQKAEEALTELQATQKQLIQSEKMASLGELTAGIAHEIQNPLNFVNNFSEVSKELIRELVEEAEKGNTGEVKLLADDLIGNLQKIHHHGERAASIVKGMLQHSRTSSGQKELTDINALCDEYLRLAYHGLRAKDKSFNTSFTSEFDKNIGSINIVPQDMGRVILNLINNAFYAVNERKKNTESNYEPSVCITTQRSGNHVLISVADNGKGIPSAIREKIFQPFFTTKPTGEGTGLGLSLSYDIIKAHGGELKVQSTEARPDDPDGRGHGTTFTIQLPV